jgi:fucose permease
MLSCAGIPGCGFFSWLMGVVGDATSLRKSLLLVPACFFLVALLSFLERKLPAITTNKFNN